MQKTTSDTIHDPAFYVALDREKLANPDFLSAFSDGVGAYEAACEDRGRSLTGYEVCQDISEELNPSPRRRAAMEAATRYYGTSENPTFTAGFLAGWLYAHLHAPKASVAALPETQPLSAVLSFRHREQADIPSKHASLLRYHRQLRGWSQVRLAVELGTDEDTVSRWERGHRKPSPYYCERLCKIFQTTANKLGIL